MNDESIRDEMDACLSRLKSDLRDLGYLVERERNTNPLPVYPRHDGGPALRPHTIGGWWQVWSGGLCIALLSDKDVAPLVEQTMARSTCYVADRAESPHKVTFANGRTVTVSDDGSLDVGRGDYPSSPR